MDLQAAGSGGRGVGGPGKPLSPTQRHLDTALIERLVAAVFGPGAAVASSAPLTGGGFASVHRVGLSDGREVVLKVGPRPDTPLLEYETGMVAAEARYLRLAGPAALPGSPLADLYGAGGGPGDPVADGSEWIIMSLIPGATVAGLGDDAGSGSAGLLEPVREALGAAIARVHEVCSPTGRFGYDGGRADGATWSEAFAAMIGALLRDAGRWDVTLPVGGAEILDLVARCRGELDGVRRARLVHFDLWDGNVLCSPAVHGADLRDGDGDGDGAADGGYVLTGLVDGERHLFGDPLVDFVSPALFCRIEDEPDHPFVRGYRRAAGRGGGFTDGELLRLALYRTYLYLLMVVEMPSRGMGPDTHPQRTAKLRALLVDAVGDVRERIPAAGPRD